MNLVIDASVAMKWFVMEAGHEHALRLLDAEQELHAPDWIVHEIAHAAFKKWRNGEIEAEQARLILPALSRFLSNIEPSVPLSDRALEIAMAIRHPVYDCLYLACAERVGGVVITADRELVAAVAATPFALLIRALAAP